MEQGNKKFKSSFLIVLGEKDSNRINAIVNLMNSKGNSVQIMDRSYVLVIESDEVITTRDLRDYLNNDKDYLMIVISLDYGIAAAWRLRTDNSNYLRSVFNDINQHD